MFSMWWLLTGDMVSRFTFFISGITTTTSLLAIAIITSSNPKIGYVEKLKSLTDFKKLFKL